MSAEERFVNPTRGREDEAFDRAVRPRRLDEYVGQPRVKAQMSIFIEAARQREEALDHTLLFGPPGLGKTTLAHIIANELDVGLMHTSGPVLEKPGDLAAHLTNLEPKSVLFVDEIHRLSAVVEEVLYPALEDFQLDIIIGEGPGARTLKIDLPPFTLVGATTRAGLLTSPLRDRFGITQRLDFYDCDELAQIARRTAGIIDLPIDDAGARGNRKPLARHGAGRQPAAAPRTRLRPGQGRRPSGRARRESRHGSARGRPARLRLDGPQVAAHGHREVRRRGPRSASTVSQPRSARSAARSRT